MSAPTVPSVLARASRAMTDKTTLDFGELPTRHPIQMMTSAFVALQKRRPAFSQAWGKLLALLAAGPRPTPCLGKAIRTLVGGQIKEMISVDL